MIEYITCEARDGGYNCPAFICESCGEQVVGDGIVLWAVMCDPPVPRKSSPVFVAHKGRCDRATERGIEKAYPREKGWGVLNDSLDSFVQKLVHNATHALADDKTLTPLRHELVLPSGDQRP